jgi:hypothetical protein
MRFAVVVAVDAATTGPMRVTLGPSIVLGTAAVQSIAAGSSASYTFLCDHGITIRTTAVSIQLQVQRLTGSGNINVYTPTGLRFGGIFAASPNGWQ